MEVIGYIAAAFTLVGYFPQTIKTIRTRETRDLSLSTFALIGSSAVFWTIYGIGKGAPAIWFTNSIIVACSLIITIIKIQEG
jgi:MtN3 and saliva related transmembrane protein